MRCTLFAWLAAYLGAAQIRRPFHGRVLLQFNATCLSEGGIVRAFGRRLAPLRDDPMAISLERGGVLPIPETLSVLEHVRALASGVISTRKRRRLAVERRGSSPLVGFSYLPNLDLMIIDNPFLDLEEILTVARSIPCVALGPQLDQTWDPPKTYATKTPDSLKAMLAKHTTTVPLSDKAVKDFLGLDGGKSAHALGAWQMTLPMDPLLPQQWHLFGPAQRVPFGANVVEAWGLLGLKAKRGLAESNIHEVSYGDFIGSVPGIAVGIVDAGCSRNPDLVRKFWRNPNSPACQ